MKKIFTILGIAATVFVSAQKNLFSGSDFNTWSTFLESLDTNGLKYGVQGVGTGVGGTDCLNINSSTTTNAYVFTVPSVGTNGTYIKIKVKGTSGGLSFNVGDKFFNVPVGVTTDTTLSASAANAYTGTINAADWITLTLDLTGLTYSKTAFSVKIQKNSTPNLLVDDIKTDATLGVIDTNKSKTTLVRNTKVNNEISFGEKANVKIYNVSGSLVKSASVEKNTSLNVSSLPKGIYVVTGEVNGQSVSQKIVKE
jgi:hypothetical protein